MPHLHDFTCFFPHFNAHFFWDFSAMFDDTEGQCPIFLHGQAMKFFNLVRPRLFFLCELTKVDTSGHPLVLYLCEYSRYKFTRVITCVYVYICIYNISIYIYTCILLYDIHAWYTTFYIQSENDNDSSSSIPSGFWLRTCSDCRLAREGSALPTLPNVCSTMCISFIFRLLAAFRIIPAYIWSWSMFHDGSVKY